MLFGEQPTGSVSLYETITDTNTPADSGWDVEYCATENGPEGIAWLSSGMNKLISVLQNSTDAAFKTDIGAYTDIDRVIDYILFAFFIYAPDNLGKNIIWATFDGKTYLPSAYDLDNTWQHDFSPFYEKTADGWINGSILRSNLLFSRVMDNFAPALCARYAELRKTLLTYEHIEALFAEHLGQVPETVRAAEYGRWPQESVLYNNQLEDILRFFTERAAALDAYYGFAE